MVPFTNSLPSRTPAWPWPTMPFSVASWSAQMLTCSAEASMPARSMATGPQPGTTINPPQYATMLTAGGLPAVA
jgi:hypothetical protein